MPNETQSRTITIPDSELDFAFSRSGGKGGQNVNKVETKVIIRWNPDLSLLLTPEEKELIKNYGPLSNRVDKNGYIILYDQSERSQEKNRQNVIEKLNRLVSEALNPPKERIVTKTPRSAKEQRLNQKKHQGAKKAFRRNRNFE